ncbi:MAG: hypothetical protein DRP65_00865 [Planctomycetota bacterium]|nr:MAG: hypothetical protein DRP65_00865 [Planctomycetota bacterium]
MSVSQPETPLKYKLLFVCKGNICRSPLASFTLEKLSQKHSGKFQLIITSGGTENYNIGKKAHPLSERVGQENGVDLSSHIARQIQQFDVQDADIIIVMDDENRQRVLDLFGDEISPKIHLLMSFSQSKNADIPDPYKMPYSRYQQTYKMIREGCLGLIDELLP